MRAHGLRLSGLGLLAAAVLLSTCVSPGAPAAAGPVYVTLWFDTEDYILPASDDAAMRLAETLSGLGIRATFKVVGEKARTLERRGRRDVIAALSRHEIGYHTDFHSVHPTPAERLARAGWEEGIREFERSERAGLKDVRRIFGQDPACYGQPGASWAPHVYAALRNWDVPVYLDEGTHVGYQNQPFFYGGVLNVFNLGPYVTRVGLVSPGDLQAGRTAFMKIHDRLQSQGGGLVSIYYHPCEFVHREFWDGLNFRNGANPPRSEWKQPPAKTPAQVEQAFENFAEYMAFIKSQPAVRFVTAREMAKMHPDAAAGSSVASGELLKLAQGVQKEISFRVMDGYALSAAEIFGLMNSCLTAYVREARIPPSGRVAFAFGPSRREAAVPPREITWDQMAQASLDVEASMRNAPQVPAEVWLGAYSAPPEDYLATVGAVLEPLILSGTKPARIELRKGNFTASRYVAADSVELWGWIILPEGFRAPRLMDLAALQAWTLKPAIRIDGGGQSPSMR